MLERLVGLGATAVPVLVGLAMPDVGLAPCPPDRGRPEERPVRAPDAWGDVVLKPRLRGLAQ